MQQCGDCLKVYDESDHARCPFCNDNEADSYVEPITGSCADCDGTGRIECNVCEGDGESKSEVCMPCNGDGGMECPDCHGSGEATYHIGKKI